MYADQTNSLLLCAPFRFGLFRENIQDGGDDAEADEDQEPQGPSKGSK